MPGKPRPPKAFEYEEVKELILNIPERFDRFLLAVAYANGCRVGELKGLELKDIDVDDEFIYITTPVLKKRGLIVPKRAPPISRVGEAWLAGIILDFYIRCRENNINELIPCSRRTIQRRFQQYADCTSHSFRHTRAMHMLKQFKMSMEKIRLFFNLSPSGLVAWIARYGHLDTEDLKEHYRALGLGRKAGESK